MIWIRDFNESMNEFFVETFKIEFEIKIYENQK